MYRKGTPSADRISCLAYGKRYTTPHPKYGGQYKQPHVQLKLTFRCCCYSSGYDRDVNLSANIE